MRGFSFLFYLVGFFVVITTSSCSDVKLYCYLDKYNKNDIARKSVNTRVIFIGDAGALERNDPINTFLSKAIIESDKTLVVFLGDNIYPDGYLGDAESNEILKRQVFAAKEAEEIIFVQGNHDCHGKNKAEIERKLIYANDYLINDLIRDIEEDPKYKYNYAVKPKLSFQPAPNQLGPVSYIFNDKIEIIAIDSEIWRINSQNEINNSIDTHLEELSKLLAQNVNTK